MATMKLTAARWYTSTHSDIFDGLNFGLNECTITKTDTSSMIVVHTHINGEFLNSYWADGLLVSTPTGSTGYCLSVVGQLCYLIHRVLLLRLLVRITLMYAR